MSSSKIIKSDENAPDNLPEFTFKPFGQLVVAANKDSDTGFTPTAPLGETTGFVPLELFGDQEASTETSTDGLSEQEAPPEPVGITLTEEELEQRLRESFQSGLKEGKSLAERGLLSVFTSLRTAAEDLHVMREKVLRESEDELIKLIMMVARKLIQREVAQDGKILPSVVKAAIEGISSHDEIVIHLHPDDYFRVTTSREDYFRQELITDKMQLKADPEISPGSCRVATEMGTIDASFDSQLDEIFRRLQEERSMISMNGA